MLSILIVESITQKGPIIFFRLAEKTTGEYDAIFYNMQVDFSGSDGEDELDFMAAYLNFTQAQSVTSQQFNLSPRMVWQFDAYEVIPPGD